MALIGPDGNDMPDVLPDGVTASDYVAINARAFTEHGREAFDPDFGVGISAMIGFPALSVPEMRRRWINSLAGSGLDVRDIAIRAGNRVYRIDLELEVDSGSS